MKKKLGFLILFNLFNYLHRYYYFKEEFYNIKIIIIINNMEKIH